MTKTLTAALAAAALAAACGGGGGDGSPPPTTSFEVAAAVQSLYTGADEVFALNGTIAGQPASIYATHVAMADAPFMGMGSMQRMRRTMTITAGGMSDTSHEEHYADLGGHMLYGWADDDGTDCHSTTRAAYPASAAIGSSGMLYEAEFHDHGGGMIGRSRMTWSLDAVPGDETQAFMCIHTEFRDTGGVPTGDQERDCYRIDAAGHVLGMRVTISSPDFGTVTFQ